jgi:hypothetical protein
MFDSMPRHEKKMQLGLGRTFAQSAITTPHPLIRLLDIMPSSFAAISNMPGLFKVESCYATNAGNHVEARRLNPNFQS